MKVRGRRFVLAALVLVVAVSAGVRLADLAGVPSFVFDEKYYAADAAALLNGDFGPRGSRPWMPGGAQSAAHPELGVTLIAAGVAVFGDHPWGWRIASAVAGTLLIALVFPLARRLGLSPEWALAATILAAADSMLIVQSRVAMLDIFLALWSAACVYCALRAAQSSRQGPWIVLCGLAGGAALATKWSGGLALLAALVVLALVGRRRAAHFALQAAAVVGIAAVTYVAAYAPYFLSGHTPSQWLHLQRYMASYNWKDRGTLRDTSRPLTWPFDVNALWYSWSETAAGLRSVILLGNPLLWWGAVAAFVALTVRSVRSRDLRLGLFPLLVGLLYLPWLATSRPSYIYYMTPVVPFLAVLVAAALQMLTRRRPAPCAPQALAFAGVALVVAGLLGVAGLGESATSAAPATLARGVALVAGLTLCAAAVWRARRAEHRRAALGASAAWGWVGATAGLGLAWLPFVLGYPVAWQYFERLTWLPTWK